MKTKKQNQMLMPKEQDLLKELVWSDAGAKFEINEEWSEWLEAKLSAFLNVDSITPDTKINTLKKLILEITYAKYKAMPQVELKSILNGFENKGIKKPKVKYRMRVNESIKTKTAQVTY